MIPERFVAEFPARCLTLLESFEADAARHDLLGITVTGATIPNYYLGTYAPVTVNQVPVQRCDGNASDRLKNGITRSCNRVRTRLVWSPS